MATSSSTPSSTPSTVDSTVERSAHRRALVAAVIVTVLWSSSWVLIRFGLDDESLSPLTFAGLRYGCAAAVLWAVVLATPARSHLVSLSRRDLLGLAALGVGFYAVTQGAQFVAIDNQPAATTSLVLSLTPLAVAALGSRAIAERSSGRQVVGAALVAVGAWAYFSGDLGATEVGMIAALVALGANAASSLAGRSVNRGTSHPAVVVTTISMSVGAIILVVVGIGVEGLPTLTPAGVAIVAWLAVVNTALAFTMWNYSLRRLSAVESAGINNLMLIQIAVLAWIFLGEAPGAIGLAGIAIVSAGIYLTQIPSRPGRE